MQPKKNALKGQLFTAEVVLLAVRWYPQVPRFGRDAG